MEPHILLIDNFDSFTYNLKHHLCALGAKVEVMRNDRNDWHSFQGSHIVLSPGPGVPSSSGALMDCIAHFYGKKPILGVCLGHQALAEYSGGTLFNMEQVRHGKQKTIDILSEVVLFRGLSGPFPVGLYHSWAVRKVPQGYDLTACDAHGVVMAMENAEAASFGVQFHPESIMCPDGMDLLANFLAFS